MAGVIDEVLAGCGGGHQRSGAGVVQGAGQPAGDPVQPGDRVIGEDGVFAAGELEVVAQVGGGLGEVHRLDRESRGYPLVEGGERAHAQLAVQRGLPGEDGGERAGRVHVGVQHEPQLFQLVRLGQVSFVQDHYDPPVPFCGFGGEQV
jgi:hypothetical protein